MLSQEQYWEVDKFYSKADSILKEARDHAKKFEYDLCVRRSQEAFELFLKTMFRFIERTYPQEHDIGNEIYKVHQALKRFGFTAQKVAQIVHRNRTLGLWREKAFFDDEKLGLTSGVCGGVVVRLLQREEPDLERCCGTNKMRT